MPGSTSNTQYNQALPPDATHSGEGFTQARVGHVLIVLQQRAKPESRQRNRKPCIRPGQSSSIPATGCGDFAPECIAPVPFLLTQGSSAHPSTFFLLQGSNGSQFRRFALIVSGLASGVTASLFKTAGRSSIASPPAAAVFSTRTIPHGKHTSNPPPATF